MNKTKITWTDFTWNPVTGCSKNHQDAKIAMPRLFIKDSICPILARIGQKRRLQKYEYIYREEEDEEEKR